MSMARQGGCWVGAAGLSLLVLVGLGRRESAPAEVSMVVCAPEPAPPPTSMTLRVGGTEASIELRQDGAAIPLEGRTLHLAPRPFTVRLTGDVHAVSYFAAADSQVAQELAALDRPLVVLDGTAAAQAPHEMLLSHRLRFVGSTAPPMVDAVRREIEAIAHERPDPDGLGLALRARYGRLPVVFGHSRGYFTGLVRPEVPEDASALEVEIHAIELHAVENGELAGCVSLTLFVDEPEPGHALRDIKAAAFESVELCFDGPESSRGLLAMAPDVDRRG